jgi:bacterioferritin (cytochrome b1)
MTSIGMRIPAEAFFVDADTACRGRDEPMLEHEPEGLTSLEALGVAIRAEMDSRDLYKELAGRSENPQIRRRFELLAADEAQHLEYLKEQWEEMASGVPLKLPPSRHPKEMLTPYLRAARETDDPSGRAMFRFLADMEFEHWMTLGQEKDLLVRYPNYGQPGKTPWRAEKQIAPESGNGGD